MLDEAKLEAVPENVPEYNEPTPAQGKVVYEEVASLPDP